MESPYKLEVKNLYKIFGSNANHALKQVKNGVDKDELFAKSKHTLAVSDVSLGIKEGEIFVIMGLSGSGKSTLVRLLNRLIEPTDGQVLIDGEDVVQMSPARLREVRRKKISMVFQSFALMPHMNVLDNTAFGLELLGMPLTERKAKAQAALEQVGLGAHALSYPDQLSGGMRQRVGLARALANDPDVLLMDEAFSALDPIIRTGMQDELLKLQERDRRTIVFISHDLNEAMRIGSRIAILQFGRLVQVGTPDEILRNPANDYVASFFKEVNVSNIYTAKDIAQRKQVTFTRRRDGAGALAFLHLLQSNERPWGYIIEADRTFVGAVSAKSLQKAIDEHNGELEAAILPDVKAIPSTEPIKSIMKLSAQTACPLPVVDENGIHIGSISKAMLIEILSRT